MQTLPTGSVLAEVTAQIMGPFLLGKITDFNGLIDDAKMVIVNNLIQVFQNSQKSDGALLKYACLLYTSPSPRDATLSRMPSSA